MTKNELKFRAMALMADRNKDIRLSNTLTDCKSVKEGYKVSFGVDNNTGGLICNQMMGVLNTHIVVCMVMDGAELEKTMKELENAPGNDPVRP